MINTALAIFFITSVVVSAHPSDVEKVIESNKGMGMGMGMSDMGGMMGPEPPVEEFPIPLPSQVTICKNKGLENEEQVTISGTEAKTLLEYKKATLGKCELAMPDTAFGPAIDPAKGYYVAEIAPCETSLKCAYWVTNGVYVTMFVTTGQGVIVVDAPPGVPVVAAIKEVTSEEVTHIVYSHFHADHIAAAHLITQDLADRGVPAPEIIAHEYTLTQFGKTRPAPFGLYVGGQMPPLPTTTFTGEFDIVVNGDTCVSLKESNFVHTEGNLVGFVEVNDALILINIDVVFPGFTPFRSLAIAETPLDFIAMHDDILSYRFDYLVAGHLNRLATRDDVLQAKAHALDIQANAIQAIQAVESSSVFAAVGSPNIWTSFDAYLDVVGQTCADLTVAQWGGRLAGVELFAKSHCDVYITALRLD